MGGKLLAVKAHTIAKLFHSAKKVQLHFFNHLSRRQDKKILLMGLLEQLKGLLMGFSVLNRVDCNGLSMATWACSSCLLCIIRRRVGSSSPRAIIVNLPSVSTAPRVSAGKPLRGLCSLGFAFACVLRRGLQGGCRCGIL